MDKLAQLSIIITSQTIKEDGKRTHLAGPPWNLYLYLQQRVKEVVFIEQPNPICVDLTPTAEVTKNGKINRIYRFSLFWFPFTGGKDRIERNLLAYVFFKLRDINSLIWFSLRLGKKYDWYIGVECINAIFGILLRNLGIVKHVIYDVIDYSPQRFTHPLLNRIFHLLDKICVYYSDFTWNQTPLVEIARHQLGINKAKSAPQLVKPSGIEIKRIKQLPIEKINRYNLIYVGLFQRKDGINLIVEAFPEIVKKVPEAKLTLIGYGEMEIEIKKRIVNEGLQEKVDVKGWIGNPEKVEELLRKSAIALAPYQDDITSTKRYNDVSKPKLYLACGLPIVITRVPPVWEEIELKRAGIAVNYDKESFVQAVIKLLTDDTLFKHCRENAIQLANEYSWEKIFDRLFSEMEL